MKQHETNDVSHEELCAYVLGECEGDAVARVEAALATNAELRAQRDALAATIGLVQSACAGGAALAPEVLDGLESAARPAPRPLPWYATTPMRMAAGFAALAAGVLAGRALMQDPPAHGGTELASLERDRAENARMRQSKALSKEAAAGGARKSPLAPDSEAELGLPHEKELARFSANQDKAPAEALDQAVATDAGLLAGGRVDVDLGRSENRLKDPQDAKIARLSLQDAPGQSAPSLGQAEALRGLGYGGGGGVFTLGEGSAEGAPSSGYVFDESQGADLRARGEVHYLTSAPDPSAQPTDGALAAGRRAAGGGTFRGPGDLAPPGFDVFTLGAAGLEGSIALPPADGGSGTTATGSDDFFLGHGAEARPVIEAKDEALAAKLLVTRSKKVPNGPTSGGGGGGPSSPGPAGPATPGAAGAPGPVATPGLRPASPSTAAPQREPVPTTTETIALDAEQLEVQLRYESRDDDLYGIDLGRRQLTPAEVDEVCKHRVRVILDDCRRRPNERPRDMFFRYWGDNPFELTRLDAQSTFAVDVDTASYALARRYLAEGLLPEKAQIRTEEFVNYFEPDVAAPTEDVFAVHTDLTSSRFGNDEATGNARSMLRVVVRGREVSREERKPLTLTFVVDVSGSMKEGQRLELVKHALRLLVGEMDAKDSLSIIAFSNEARLVLPMTSAASRGVIEAAIYGLQPDGGTNAEAGLKLGYEVAASALSTLANNRVVLLSDGVANIGQTDQGRIGEDVRARREAGIYLNTVGVGMNNHNDAFLEQLADKGDGMCNYIDSAIEARRALVENFTGAFEPIARDVKIQVEFDPAQVARYRLLGYENRAIADADFRNDAVDAGEVGAGHQVTALYELELTGAPAERPLAEVRLRWKAPTGAGRDPREDSATERSFPVSIDALTAWEAADLGYKRATIVAQFAELLRRSVHARGDSLDELIGVAAALAPQMADPDFDELVAMMQKSRELVLRGLPARDTLTLCIDSIRRNHILRAQYEELMQRQDQRRQAQNDAVIAELDRQNHELEARIEELIRGELQQQMK
ncbi:MAG: von Willebrand factor type A domain-containing protein [Planctomycetes bacterium]|nr:von Willebrand factor type A domain-containing protein [Planctomycetota bacterium]